MNDEYDDALNIKREEIKNIKKKKQENKKENFIKKFSGTLKVSERYQIILNNEKLFFHINSDFDLNKLMNNPISSWSNISVTTKRGFLKRGFLRRFRKIIKSVQN